MLIFFFYKLGEQEGGTGFAWGRGLIGKRCGRVNIVQTLCTHYVNGKVILVETISGMEGEGDKAK
jgi:hypothetical protein